MKKRTPKQIGWIYLGLSGTNVLFGYAFHAGIYMDFLMSNLHDYFLANSVNVIFFLTLFIAEIPTGAYADTFGRKASYVLASLLWSLGLIIYGISDGFIGFAVAESILAVGTTCVSGAFEAWLIDNIDHVETNSEKSQILKAQLFARESSVTTVSAIIGSIVGAWVYSWNPASCFLVSGILMLIHALIAKTVMSEDYFEKKEMALKIRLAEIKRKINLSLAFVKNNQTIKTIASFSAIQSFACMGINMLWQPFFKTDVPVFWLGGLFALWMICGSIGAEMTLRLKMANQKPMLTLKQSIIWSGILIIISASCPFPWSLIAITLSQIPRGMFHPIFKTTIHATITDSQQRATIASCATMARHLGGAIGLLLSGLSAKHVGIPTTWIWSGGSMILGAWWLYRTHQKSDSR